LNKGASINKRCLSNCLNMLQSSSPSYLLLASVDGGIASLDSDIEDPFSRLFAHAQLLRDRLEQIEGLEIFQAQTQDAAHIVIRLAGMSADDLARELADRGVFAETTIGKDGLLLLLGTGNDDRANGILTAALTDISRGSRPTKTTKTT